MSWARYQSASQSPAESTIDAGAEWIVDAQGCSAHCLRDLDCVRELCDDVIAEMALTVVGQARWHQFPGEAGMTGLYLLSESHLACHTYPERGLATFNLYCCRPRPEWPWAQEARRRLQATRVSVRRVDRGRILHDGRDQE